MTQHLTENDLDRLLAATAAEPRIGVRRSKLTARLRMELEVTSDETHADPQVAMLREVLHGLHPLDREIVRLVHWDGFTLIEAAQLLGKRPRTVRSRYHRAGQWLRAELSVTAPASAAAP